MMGIQNTKEYSEQLIRERESLEAMLQKEDKITESILEQSRKLDQCILAFYENRSQALI